MILKVLIGFVILFFILILISTALYVGDRLTSGQIDAITLLLALLFLGAGIYIAYLVGNNVLIFFQNLFAPIV